VRLVLDTNVVLSALLWHGTPHVLVGRGREKGMAFYTSSALLQELGGILERKKFAKILAVSGATTKAILRDYAGFAHVVRTQALAHPVCPDPDDDQVLACALAAQAELIVSGDNDLLGLKEYQGIPIVTPAEALTRIEAS